jgi:hypothetical protein
LSSRDWVEISTQQGRFGMEGSKNQSSAAARWGMGAAGR